MVLPAWLKDTAQVPEPLVTEMETELAPLPKQDPAPAIDTARPELAVAATVKLLLYAALPGAGVVIVML